LEAKIKALEVLLSEKEAAATSTISRMETDIATSQANIKSLEDEIVKYEKSEGELQDKIDDLEKVAKDNSVFIKAGKQFIEDTKAEIHKISVQVDGNDYNKDLVDKQLVAFNIDLEALTQFKENLEARRAKLFKSGDIWPDEKKTKKTIDQEEYALGQAIGKGNVIPINKNA